MSGTDIGDAFFLEQKASGVYIGPDISTQVASSIVHSRRIVPFPF